MTARNGKSKAAGNMLISCSISDVTEIIRTLSAEDYESIIFMLQTKHFSDDWGSMWLQLSKLKGCTPAQRTVLIAAWRNEQALVECS